MLSARISQCASDVHELAPTLAEGKQAMGFRQFLLRGVGKVGGEWKLVCLAYHFRRLHKMTLA